MTASITDRLKTLIEYHSVEGASKMTNKEKFEAVKEYAGTKTFEEAWKQYEDEQAKKKPTPAKKEKVEKIADEKVEVLSPAGKDVTVRGPDININMVPQTLNVDHGGFSWQSACKAAFNWVQAAMIGFSIGWYMSAVVTAAKAGGLAP